MKPTHLTQELLYLCLDNKDTFISNNNFIRRLKWLFIVINFSIVTSNYRASHKVIITNATLFLQQGFEFLLHLCSFFPLEQLYIIRKPY